MKEQQTCYRQSDPTREREAPGNKHSGRRGAGRGAARSALVREGRRLQPELQPKSGREWGKNTPPLALFLDVLQGSLGVEVHIHQIPAQSSSEEGNGTSDIYMAYRDKQVGLEMASIRAPAALDHSQ